MNLSTNSGSGTKLSDYYIEVLQRNILGFEVDDYNREPIEDIKKYIDRDPSGPLNIDKGICLIGPPGTGKTELLKGIQSLYRVSKHPLQFNFLVVWEKAIEYKTSGPDIYIPIRRGNWFLDELGRRDIEITNYYGKGADIGDEMIQIRYRLFTSAGLLTHFTTNLSIEELEKEYDKATFSRLRHMCNFISVVSHDRRPTAKVKSAMPEIEAQHVPTKEELKSMEDAFIKDRILDPYKKFVDTGEFDFPEPISLIYDKLKELGVINLSTNDQSKIWVKAKEFVRRRHWRDGDFRRRWEKMDEDIKTKILFESKRLAAIEYLQECKEFSIDLESIIINKRKLK